MSRHAYSIRGKPARMHKLLSEVSISLLFALMSVKGLPDCEIVQGCIDGDVFCGFVHSHLIAHLQPFHGM